MTIDHIVWAVPDLDAGMALIQQLTTIRPTYGGVHPGRGTHNAILPLSRGIYLEIIAPANSQSHCWMDIHMIQEPEVVRWAWKATELEDKVRLLESSGINIGPIFGGRRIMKDGTVLKWDLTDPDAFKSDKIIPFLIDWKNGPHPTTDLETPCDLLDVKMTHPEPVKIDHIFTQLNAETDITRGPEPTLNVFIDSPIGIVEL